jgi:hypothetical protein
MATSNRLPHPAKLSLGTANRSASGDAHVPRDRGFGCSDPEIMPLGFARQQLVERIVHGGDATAAQQLA